MNSVARLCLAWFALVGEGPVDFDTEITPVLTRSGCNAGACHGAAAGRGGFRLSLWGTDPAADYEAIVHAFEGRRINLAQPSRSLLLRKPTGQLSHGGDLALDEDGPGAKRLLDWIAAGAPRGVPRRLTNFDVTPRRQLASEIPARLPLRAFARFDNGPPEDVSAWTVFSSTDPVAVEVAADGVALVKRRGQHVVTARFLDRVTPIQLTVPLTDNAVELTDEPRANFIDDEVLRVLADLRIPLSRPASDGAYLRRVTLDLTGRLPDPELVESYVVDSAPDKRQRLVDRLLLSEAFTDYWTLRFARLLRLHALPNESAGVQAYGAWLRRAISQDTGLDVLAHQLLTATGDAHVVGPANFGRMVSDARGQAELVGQFFLGVRLGCANCHNHPLDRWTQDDYHGLAAVFARLERGREVRWASRGAVTNLRTGEPAVPRIPGERYLSVEGDHRQTLAEWLTIEPSRGLAKASVNRLWRAMFGRGLVDPPDDLRATNPPTHPELFELLAEDFARHGYRLRHTLRRIALSHTYGRSDVPVASNARDDRFYSHASRRPLEPEILADAIADVTGLADPFEGQPAGTRAVTLLDPLAPAPSLDILGRCARAAGCDERAAPHPGLAAQLHLLNGDLLNRKLADPHGRLQQLLAADRTVDQIVDEFYVRALARHPTAAEQQDWRKRLASADRAERGKRLEDFTWSLLNSRAFRENH